jgi:zinc transport system ATP-binding protein
MTTPATETVSAGGPDPAGAPEIVVQASDLFFAWRDEQWVLDDVNLSVERGTFLGIVGPNGGGKTTLVRLITAELLPTRGRILVFGAAAANLGSRRSLIGYLPQRVAIPSDFPVTALEVVMMGGYSKLGLFRRVPRSLRDLAMTHLQKVGMDRYAARPIGKLSAGQQQRVLIARALVNEPDLLLLDEPTVGVDTGGQASFFSLLRSLARDMSLTIIMVTHDLLQIGHYADRLACLNRKVHWHQRSDQVTQEEIRDALSCELGDFLAYERQFSDDPDAPASSAVSPHDHIHEDHEPGA